MREGLARWFGPLALGMLTLAVPARRSAAQATKANFDAALRCEAAATAGRVRCALAVEVPPQQRLAWADVLIVDAPAFARPLRSRVAHRGSSEQSRLEIPFALLATSAGRGRLVVRARAVICPRAARAACRPRAKEAAIDLVVGS